MQFIRQSVALIASALAVTISNAQFQQALPAVEWNTSGGFELGFALPQGPDEFRYVIYKYPRSYFYWGTVYRAPSIEMWSIDRARLLGSFMTPSRRLYYAGNEGTIAAFLSHGWPSIVYMYRFDADGEEAETYGAVEVGINATTVAVTRNLIWVGYRDGTVRAFAYDTRNLQPVENPDRPMTQPIQQVAAIQLFARSNRTQVTALRANPYRTHSDEVWVGGEDGQVMRLQYDPNTQRINVIGKPAKHNFGVADIVFTRSYRAVGTTDGNVHVYGTTDTLIYSIKNQRVSLRSYQMSAYSDNDHDYLILGNTADAAIYNLRDGRHVGSVGMPLCRTYYGELWTGENTYTFSTAPASVRTVPQMFAPYPIISGDVWRDAVPLTTIRQDIRLAYRREFYRNSAIYAVAVSDSGKLAIGYADGTVVIRDTNTPEMDIIEEQRVSSFPIFSLAWATVNSREDVLLVAAGLGEIHAYSARIGWQNLLDEPRYAAYAVHVLRGDDTSDARFVFTFGRSDGKVVFFGYQHNNPPAISEISSHSLASPVYSLESSHPQYNRLEVNLANTVYAYNMNPNNNYSLTYLGRSGYYHLSYNRDGDTYISYPANTGHWIGPVAFGNLAQQRLYNISYGGIRSIPIYATAALDNDSLAAALLDGVVIVYSPRRVLDGDNPFVNYSHIKTQALREVYEPRPLRSPILAMAGYNDLLITGDLQGYLVAQRRLANPRNDLPLTHNLWAVDFDPVSGATVLPSHPVQGISPIGRDALFLSSLFVHPKPGGEPDERIVFDTGVVYLTQNSVVNENYDMYGIYDPRGFVSLYRRPSANGKWMFHDMSATFVGNPRTITRLFADIREYTPDPQTSFRTAYQLVADFPYLNEHGVYGAYRGYAFAEESGDNYAAAIALAGHPVRIYTFNTSTRTWSHTDTLPMTPPPILNDYIIMRFIGGDPRLLAVAYRPYDPNNPNPWQDCTIEFFAKVQGQWTSLGTFRTGLTQMYRFSIDGIIVGRQARIAVGGREGLTFYSISAIDRNPVVREVGRSHAIHNLMNHVHDCYWVRFNRANPDKLGVADYGSYAVVDLRQVPW